MKFCHPKQMIKGCDDQNNLMILQSGSVGYICRSKGMNRLKNIII